jgi:integrase
MEDPVETALAFVRAQRSKETYRLVISYFLRWSGLKAQDFVERASSQPKWAESLMVNYIQSLEKKGLSGSTVALYVVGIRALLDYNDVTGINWKKVRKAIPPARSYGTDRPPTVDEIRRILQFCDIRARAMILCLASGGFRVGSFDYFSLRDYSVIRERERVLAGRLVIYKGEREEYFTFLTPEAVQAFEAYFEFRKRAGEELTPSSPLFRDAWDTEVHGAVKDVRPLKAEGVNAAVNRILKAAGLKEREFKAIHGFRKFFKTRAEQAMKSAYVEILMGHSLGISNSYLKPTEKELLAEYLKAVPFLTIQEADELKRELSKKDEDVKAMERQLLDIRFRLENIERRL